MAAEVWNELISSNFLGIFSQEKTAENKPRKCETGTEAASLFRIYPLEGYRVPPVALAPSDSWKEQVGQARNRANVTIHVT